MFDLLLKKVNKELASFSWKLAHTNDSYRLAHILHEFDNTIVSLQMEADDLVKQLEDLDK